MFTWLLKKFIPSADTLAALAAEQIQNATNKATAGKEEVVGKYAEFAQEATNIVDFVAKIMKDGNIDDEEREGLADMMTPLFEKALTLIK